MGFFDDLNSRMRENNDRICDRAQENLDREYKKAYRSASTDAQRDYCDRKYEEKCEKIDSARWYNQ